MALGDLYLKMKAECDERGYSIAELDKTRKKLSYERREWERKFDDYIEQMLYILQCVPDNSQINRILAQAAYLADQRRALLNERFEEVDTALDE